MFSAVPLSRRVVSAVLLMILALSFLVQATSPGGSDVEKHANEKFKNHEYKDAFELYKLALESNKESAFLNYQAGLCCTFLRFKEKAVTYIDQAIRYNPNIAPDAQMVLGKALLKTNEFHRALTCFKSYQTSVKLNTDEATECTQMIARVNYGIGMSEHPVIVRIENLGQLINTAYPDYAPFITADEKTLIYTSRRNTTTGGQVDKNDLQYFEDIYISHRGDNHSPWGKPANLGDLINSEKHDACLSISPDGKSLFLYKNTGGGDIYESHLELDGKWGKPVPLPPNINSSYFESSASVTADGKMLVFVSERPGGYGHGDIYYSKKNEKNEWGNPVNIGHNINTSEDEITPYISPDGKTLYFSSMGHETMGGYDIFKSVYQDGLWSDPVNVGYPINSGDDDLHFVVSNDGRHAYFSDIRAGGYGDRDIYIIDFKPEKLFGEMPLTIITPPDTHKAPVKNIPREARTDIKLAIPIDTATLHKNDMPEYFRKPGDKEMKALMPDKLIILFEKNSNILVITPELSKKLNDFVIYLNQNSKQVALIKGYSDISGTSEINLKISEKRAVSVLNHLLVAGVFSWQLKSEGLGEANPRASNDTEEGRILNRRVEVEIQK